MLNVGLLDNSNALSRLSRGLETCIIDNNYPNGSPFTFASNLDANYPAKNIYMYFAAHGDATLFNFLIAGQYIKICLDSTFATSSSRWYYSFTADLSVTASFANSLANKWLVPKETITKANDPFYYNTDGEIPESIYGYSHKLRFDVQIPQTVARSYLSGSIDAIYLYTYTT
jgi:hypothetical protein